MVILEANHIKLLVDEDKQTIKIVQSYPDCTNVCAKSIQRIIIRSPDAVSDPLILNQYRIKKVAKHFCSLIFSHQKFGSAVTLFIQVINDELSLHFSIKHSQPIWLVEWEIDGLRLENMIVPALGGQKIRNTMPEDTVLSYKYPFWWNAQFFVGETDRGGIYFRSKDQHPNLKLLRIGKKNNKFILSLGLENSAPIESKSLEMQWFLGNYTDTWHTVVDIHRLWMQKEFHLKPLDTNENFPDWAENINFVLELWGARKDQDTPLHTFDRMIERLRKWKELYNPENTLVYLPGFAENGIDSHAPDYNPSEMLGGGLTFKKLVKEAHLLGYRIMIHTNVLAMTYTHPLFQKFKKFQVIDVFDRPQGWGLDIDGDWLAEPYFAYINPGYSEWGKLMEGVIGDLIKRYHIDAVFLDQTLLAFNVSNGPNFIKGMLNHVTHLQKSFPNILFAGEGLHERVIAGLPMTQIHGIDSILQVHGMEGVVSWREVHPVSSYLFGKYTRIMAHLLTKHPTHPMFRRQEEAYASLGVIPALCLYHNDQEMDIPAVHQMIKRARELKDSIR